jgi:2-iminobutanoate/2-iminopropanoate deaminase
MKKQVVETANAPAPVGPYSQAIVAGDLIFVSGQAAVNPETGRLVEGDISAQTNQTLLNLKAVLEAAGSDLEHVVKTSVFLLDMNDFAEMNEVYRQFFPVGQPARTTIQAARLPIDARVEIDLIATRK